MAHIEITTKIGCSNDCIYCPQDSLIEAYAKRSDIFLLSFDTFKACLKKIPSGVEIIFSGMCEPWLNPECTKMVLYAYEKGYKIKVFTSLVGMSLSDINLLTQVPFGVFVVHLPSDGGNEKIAIDQNYLNVLGGIRRSGIKATYVFYGKDIHLQVKSLLGENTAQRWGLISRARNSRIAGRPFPRRRIGRIGCFCELHQNVLLPNGDVILCCMDYNMQHILGNLLESDYSSLFNNEEFFKIRRGLRDNSLDILCRYCEIFTYNISLSAKIYNTVIFCYEYARSINNFNDLYRLMQRKYLKLKNKLVSLIHHRRINV